VPPPVVTVNPSAPVVNLPSDPGNPWLPTLLWVWTALGSVFAASGVKQAFWPSAQTTLTTVATDAQAVQGKLTDILKKIKDPATRDTIDSILLRAVQSGIPGTALQTGASLIPGVGPIASQVEPIVRQLVIDQLSKGTSAPAPAPTAVPPVAAPKVTTPLIDAAAGAVNDSFEQAASMLTKRVMDAIDALKPKV
jgi:hypothetical protein